MAGGTGRVRIVGGRIVDESEITRKRVIAGALLVCGGVAVGAGYAWWRGQPPAAAPAKSGPSATMTATPLTDHPPVRVAAVADSGAARDIGSAVAATLESGAGAARSDQSFVAALRNELRQKLAPQESPQAALDRMAKDKREAHTQNVLNRVTVSSRAANPTAASDALRNTINALVDDASAGGAKPAAADAAFVAALTPEARDRENETRTITVQAGDSLSAIAMRAYGDPNKYMKIFEANPRTLTNPHQLYIGMVLRVPN